jgi:hypothetical protein
MARSVDEINITNWKVLAQTTAVTRRSFAIEVKLTSVSTTAVTAASTILYTVNQYLTLPGTWWYGVDSAGAVGAAENYFTVAEQNV